MQEWDREWPGALLARRTRTMKRCSSDARSRGQPWPLPPRLGGRGVEGEERKEGRPGNSLCSRNAQPQKALVGRAQWKINQPPSLKRYRASLEGSSVTSLDGRSGTNTGAIPKEEKRASSEGSFSRVVEGSLGHSPKGRYGESEGPRLD